MKKIALVSGVAMILALTTVVFYVQFIKNNAKIGSGGNAPEQVQENGKDQATLEEIIEVQKKPTEELPKKESTTTIEVPIGKIIEQQKKTSKNALPTGAPVEKVPIEEIIKAQQGGIVGE